MAIAELTSQRATAEGNSASASVTFPATPTNGNLIVVSIAARDQITGDFLPAMPSGWAIAESRTNGANTMICLCWKIAGASEPTAPVFTLDDSNHWVIACAEFSGVMTTSPIDVSIDNNGASSTAGTTGALAALAGSGELVITAYCNNNIFTWSAHDNSQTETGEIASTAGVAGNRVNLSMAKALPSGTGSITYGATLSTAGNWMALAVAFKPAASAGPMTGSTTLGFTQSGTLSATGVLSGDAPLSFVATMLSPLTGDATLTFTQTGNITQATGLTGNASLSFNPKARFPYGGAKFRQMWNTYYDKRSKLLAAIYAKTKALAEKSVNVLNPSFENDQTGWTFGAGWNVVTAASVSIAAVEGTFIAAKQSGAADTTIVNAGRFGCSEGKRINGIASFRTASGTGTAGCQLLWYDAAGTLLSTTEVTTTTAASVSGIWKQVIVTGVAPASAVWACLGIRVISYTTGSWYIDKCAIEVVVTNQSDLPPVNSGNVGSVWTGLSITYTPGAGTSTTHTINVSAATLVMGSVSVAYNASSANVTQARSTTVTYWLYYIDPTYTGGSKTLNTTTTGPNAVNNNSYVWVGSVTCVIPASGGTGGTGEGGGGGGCVVCESFLPGAIEQALYIRPGDMMELAEASTLSPGTGLVSYSKVKLEPCYRIVTSNLVSLVCSESAPIPVRSGGYKTPKELMGHLVPVMVYGEAAWDTIADIQFVGLMRVQHITVGDRCFWAGEEKGRYILHHNIKPNEPV